MSLLLRDSWLEAWQSAHELAVEALQRADFEQRCEMCGAVYSHQKQAAEISFLSRDCRVAPPDFDVTPLDGGDEIPLTEKILILHYMERATGKAPAGEWITFAEVPGGDRYLSNFRARSVDRLVRAFAGQEETLEKAALALGGEVADFGDAGARLQALPRVPMIVMLWRGDDEFPASGNILFDRSVADYLSVEDLVVLAQTAATRLCLEKKRSGL